MNIPSWRLAFDVALYNYHCVSLASFHPIIEFMMFLMMQWNTKSSQNIVIMLYVVQQNESFIDKFLWTCTTVHVNGCHRCKWQHLRQTFNNFVVQFMRKTCVTTTKYMTQKFFMLFVVKQLQNIAMLCIFAKLRMFLYLLQSY